MLWPDEQMSAISATLEAACSGQPTVLSVLGTPGMGKPSQLGALAAIVARLAPAPAPVSWLLRYQRLTCAVSRR